MLVYESPCYLLFLSFFLNFVMQHITQKSMGLVLLQWYEMSINFSWQHSTSTSNIMSQWVFWRIYLQIVKFSNLLFHAIGFFTSGIWCKFVGSSEWSWICSIKLWKVSSWRHKNCYWECFSSITYDYLFGWCYWRSSFLFLQNFWGQIRSY